MNLTKLVFGNTLYFLGLDGLLAIAAITVIVFHFNLFLPDFFNQPILFRGNEIAQLSVILFFTLSGFLITYLLMVEKEMHGTVSIRNFYLKNLTYLASVLSRSSFIVPVISFYKEIRENPTISNDLLKILFVCLMILPNTISVLIKCFDILWNRYLFEGYMACRGYII